MRRRAPRCNLRARPRSRRALAITALAVACGSATESNVTTVVPDGVLRVSTTTSGTASDPNGYTLLIDGISVGRIGVNDERSVTVVPGQHEAGLDGLADGCTVDGRMTRTLTVDRGGETRVDFQLVCSAQEAVPGAIQVILSTVGQVRDPDGYTLDVADTAVSTRPQDTILLAFRAPQSFPVALRDQAANCVPTVTEQTVAVAPGDTTDITFTVMCLRDPILFERPPDLWVVESDGSVEVRLTEGTGNNRLDLAGTPGGIWDPARSRVLFVSDRDGDLDVYVMALNKSATTHFNRPGVQLEPAWSPDGTQILFASDERGDLDVWVMNADGTGAQPVSATSDPERHATWAPDGRVTFLRRDDPLQEIWIVNADGSGLRNLSRLPRGGDPIHDYFAYWAPDGSTFVFKRITFDLATHQTVAADLYAMRADGSGLVNLTNLPTRSPDFRLSWNPAGTAVSFVLCQTLQIVNCDLYRMRPNGTGLSRLTVIDGGVDAPSWAPETDFGGTRGSATAIAFSCRDPRDGDWEICVVDADGSGQRQLTFNTRPDLVPHWR